MKEERRKEKEESEALYAEYGRLVVQQKILGEKLAQAERKIAQAMGYMEVKENE